jgi:predicted ArsR family transcriptional regulator
MKPVDFRNDTFEGLRKRLRGQREETWLAWLRHGPCTTRQLAERCGITIFTVRPRVCELVDLGMAVLSGKDGREGVYRALGPEEVEQVLANEAADRGAGIQEDLL